MILWRDVDMFGNKKMYKKGLADAMQAYEAFGRKQEAALEHMREEVRKGNRQLEAAISDLGEDLNGIYGYLTSKEKAALYHLSTPMDIKDLEDEEKRLLLAILYQLSFDEGDGVTDAQRSYIRSVQKYLEITNPQTEAELSAVGDIDSLETQKSFLQVVLEFLYLQEGDELSDEQEDFLGYFSVNRKQAALIEERVSRLFNAVGNQGIAEKYGYVPKEEPEEDKETETAENGYTSFLSNSVSEEQSDEIAKMCFARGDYCFETENYVIVGNPFGGLIFRRPTYKIDKRNCKWTEVELLDSTSILYSYELNRVFAKNAAAAVGDTIYYAASDGAICALDADTCQSPKQITNSSCRSISICGKNIVYVKSSNVCLYEKKKKKHRVIASGLDNASATFAAPDGVFFSYKHSDNWRCSVLSFYDFNDKKVTACLSVNCGDSSIQKILFADSEKVYVACWHDGDGFSSYAIKCLLISRKTMEEEGTIQLNECECIDTLFMSNSSFNKDSIYSYPDMLLYIAKGGILKSLNYVTGESTEIAPNGISSDDKRHPAHMMRIGKWVYYEGDSSDNVNKVSLDAPGELEIIEVYDYTEKDIRSKEILGGCD